MAAAPTNRTSAKRPRAGALSVEYWPIERPLAYARNARLCPESAIDKVAASIAEFGWRQPIVVDEQGVIMAGHTRLLAARKLGLAEVPVHVAAGLTPAQAKAYRLMDNRSNQETSWDLELLPLELEELLTMDIDPALTGFDGRRDRGAAGRARPRASPTPTRCRRAARRAAQQARRPLAAGHAPPALRRCDQARRRRAPDGRRARRA